MNAWPEPRRRGLVAATLAAAGDWLLEPAERERSAPGEHGTVPPDPPPRPVVAVIGLARRCGATTVARALAVELARRDPVGAAAVAGGPGPTGPALASPAAGRIARAVAALGCDDARVAGRLCLVPDDESIVEAVATRSIAPLVLDVGHGRQVEGPVALADAAVLVATPAVEPALAAVVAASVARTLGEPSIVVNRALDPGAWANRPVKLIGEARLGAKLALVGRDPRGALGRAAAELADRFEGITG